MARKLSPISLAVPVVVSLMALPAFAQSARDGQEPRQAVGAEPRSQEPADQPAPDPAAREKLEAFAASCDRTAAAPLDPDAKAAPVHIYALMGLARQALNEALEACGQARAGFPEEPRFRLQLARVVFANRDMRKNALVELRALAGNGKAEASFLLFLKAKDDNLSALRAPDEVRDALASLQRAADAGHGHALRELREELRFGIYGKPDIDAALKVARTMANLPQQGPAGPAADEEQLRRFGRYIVAGMLIEGLVPASDEELKSALAEMTAQRAPDFPQAAVALAQALRAGRGIAQDAIAARKILEEEQARGHAFGAAILADMLAHGEGGPADLPRALQLLDDTKNRFAQGRAAVTMKLMLGNRLTGRDPRRAIRAMDIYTHDIAEIVPAARLLVDYNEKTSGFLAPATVIRRLESATAAGNREAGFVLADLLRSRNYAFRKDESALFVLRHMAEAGDIDAQIALARMHFTNLDSTSSPTAFGPLVYDQARIAQIVDAAAQKQNPAALLLQGELTRKGMIYPQDDRAATQAIQRAAQAGHVPAMLALATAYDDGLGVPKNPREYVRWLRAAAATGSMEAKDRLGRAFVFDWKDRLLNVREGVSEPIAKWANSEVQQGPFAASDVSRIFTGSRSA